MPDLHVPARGMLPKVAHPRLGEVVLPGAVPRLSATPGEIREPGRLLGEDSDEVLGRVLGLSPERIVELREARAVR